MILHMLYSNISFLKQQQHYHPPRTAAKRLVCELATDGTRKSVDALGWVGEVGVDISVESLRVGLDLSDAETSALVLASGVVGEAGDEWAGQAADGDAVVLASNWLWVGESDSWWARHAAGRLVDVSCGPGWGAVLAADVVEADVVADGVELAVDAEVVEADGTWETASLCVHHVDDLLWDGLDAVGAGEWDWEALSALEGG